MPEVLPPHIVQSPAWGKFKKALGKKVFRVGKVQFSVHQLPLFSFLKLGYCPKVNPFEIEWKKIKSLAQKEGVFAIRFDVPNLPQRSKLAFKAETLFQAHCQKSPSNTFAKRTIILDLTPPPEALLAQMHPKTRYNIRLAQRKGVVVKREDNKKGIEILIRLQKETAKRQKFYLHPDSYYRKLWQILGPKKMAYILVAYFKKEPLVAWMLFVYQGVLYYPYGGSTTRYRQLMPSNLVGWKAILLGKKLNCKIFDMWGAADPNKRNDPWWGFTRFKLGYGGRIVEFIDSYDLVINPLLYRLFTTTYSLGWKLLRLKRWF